MLLIGDQDVSTSTVLVIYDITSIPGTILTLCLPKHSGTFPSMYKGFLGCVKFDRHISEYLTFYNQGMFPIKAFHWGQQGARDNFSLQIRNIVERGYKSLGERPVIIGECGIPMDMKCVAGLNPIRHY